MANRPVFVSDDVFYVKTINTEFVFFNGLSKAQRQRSSDSLQEAFREDYPDARVLEVSRFSRDELGNALSAFNLQISLSDGKKVPVELAFQAGKVFKKGGPYKDLLNVSPKDAKTDPRLKESGRIIGFEFEGREFPTEPETLFYTWLYLHALDENKEIADRISEYDAFTDIVFNPAKSINCQAYVCAVYVTLRKKKEVRKALEDIDFLSKVLCGGVSRTNNARHPVAVDKPKKKAEEKVIPAFQENDVIVHPKYGEGKVMFVEKGAAETYLTVRFGTLEKTLAGSWVSAHCQLKQI